MQAKQILNVMEIRKNFAILSKNNLIYLDNSATSLTPNSVIEAMKEYYENYNANVHRGIYSISQKATEEYELAHKKVANFINAEFEEIIFTKNATESLNLLAYVLTKNLNQGDEILLSEMEHHSNLVPWQQIAKSKSLVVKYIPIDEYGKLDINKIKEMITEKTKIVSVTHMSNVLGTINDVKTIAELSHNKNALLIVDGAQSTPHFSIDVKYIDCDFFVFSGHKALGPTGVGVLYGKKELLQKLEPFLFGGGMISEVSFYDSKWAELPWKFEAGTPNIAGSIGLGKAIDFLNNIGMDKIKEYENELTKHALSELRKISGITIYGLQEAEDRGSVISFNLNGVHSHDVATILDRYSIAIRAGHMCAMPLLHEKLKVGSVCRISLCFYNTKEEIDSFIIGIKKIKEIFKYE